MKAMDRLTYGRDPVSIDNGATQTARTASHRPTRGLRFRDIKNYGCGAYRDGEDVSDASCVRCSSSQVDAQRQNMERHVRRAGVFACVSG